MTYEENKKFFEMLMEKKDYAGGIGLLAKSLHQHLPDYTAKQMLDHIREANRIPYMRQGLEDICDEINQWIAEDENRALIAVGLGMEK